MTREHLVCVVEADWRVRQGLRELLSSLSFEVETFRCTAEYLEFDRPDVPGCLILDVELADASGIDFQADRAAEPLPPIVFITGYGDIRSSVRALKAGAIDYLIKPLCEDQLVAAVREALVRDRAQRYRRSEVARLRDRFETLTRREREVLPLIVSGRMNKQIAFDLGISQVTVEVHRRHIMHKMQAGSLALLVRMAVALQLPCGAPPRLISQTRVVGAE